MTPVRVTFVSAHANQGGVERYMSLLLESLDPAWVDRIVFLGRGALADRLRGDGLAVAEVPTAGRAVSIVRSAWRVRSLLARPRAEVVHADGIKAALVSVLATVGTPTPVVWVKHDFSWDGPLARLVARRCACVVGVSEAVVAPLRAAGLRNVWVVHNGVPELEVDRGMARETLVGLAGGDGPLVALVGRLHPAKGQREIVAITASLRARFPGLRIVLIGDVDPFEREYAAALRREVAAGDLGDAVVFTGPREDAATLVGGCDVVVVPSVPDERRMGREGFGFVAVEAMNAGTPVVAYADGGLPEVLGSCGLLVRPGDRAGLADAIARLLEDGALRERLGACGRERVRSSFSLGDTVEAMTAVYRGAARREEETV